MLRSADLVFSNLACCFYESVVERTDHEEGFYAPPQAVAALPMAGVRAVGIANNVNYGAPAIRASVAQLESLGIACTGAGANAQAAARAAIVTVNGVRYGFLQHTSVYWTRGHEAGSETPGVATVCAHTAYRPRIEDIKTLTRPGAAPEIVTWTDPAALEKLRADVSRLRGEVDVLVASHHWGLDGEVLDYQREIAHAVIDAGADLVFGHGLHMPLPVEVYDGKVIFYGAGSFPFDIGHGGRKHPDWLGLMPVIELDGTRIEQVSFRFVRHNARDETVFCAPGHEMQTLSVLEIASLGATLDARAEDVLVAPDAIATYDMLPQLEVNPTEPVRAPACAKV